VKRRKREAKADER